MSASAPTEPTESPTSEEAPTGTPEETPSPSGTDEDDSVEESNGLSTPSDAAPSGLPQPEAGEPLTLSDFFQPDGNWSENSYSVADQDSVKGIGSEVSSCYEDSSDTELELRLQNKFDQLSFSVGQSNASERSDQRVVVRVLGDNEQLDVNRIPFNKIQQFQVDVQDTNAVRILFHLDEEVEQCYGGSVQAVVHDISVK
ncbi:hypothetical protein ACFYE2_07080 [Kocuria sp. CPCC 205300]|uniref:hypothetical protein n=1 Tax=Kocuria sabuli TaxID=3071448 RepID=UPI0036D9D3D5